MTNPPGAMPPLPDLRQFHSSVYGVIELVMKRYGQECADAAAAPLIARVAELQAEREVLREALDWCVAEINRESPAVINARAALTPTKD